MKLTYTTVFTDLINDFYRKNEILVICLAVIVLLLLFIMIFTSISKSRYIQALKRMSEVTEESRWLQNAFIVNMTHEIRTPLNVIVGFTTTLAETDNLDKEQRVAFLKEINENKDTLLQLVNDSLDYSKIEANTMGHNDDGVDVNALILETCIAENAHSRLPGIQAEFVGKLPQCHLRIDRVRFGQVIGNLIRNALKFTEQNCMKVGCQKLNNQNFYFYVADTGCDIEEEGKRVIFEHFVKMDCNIRETGLGLSICRSIIEHYGDGIGVESKEGEGSTFYFTLSSKLEYMGHGKF